MKIRELSEALGLTVHALPDPDREITGVYIGDLLSWVMGRAKAGCVWITIMSNQNCIAVATLSDAAAILLAEGVTPDEELVKLSMAKGINLLSSSEPAYETAVRLSGLSI